MAVEQAQKRCTRCGLEKDVDQFNKNRKHRDGLSYYCRNCISEYNRDHNRRRDPESRRNALLLRNFGITVDQYEEMLKVQDGLCAICKRPETMMQRGRLRRLCVDHDHRTGKVRGLLCSGCNRAIGHLGDDPVRADAAASYLRSWI